MRKNEKGFTLVELIVVIAIVAILASVAIVGYTQFIQNARESKAQTELDQVVNMVRADALGTVDPEGLKIGETTGRVKVKAGKLEFAGEFSNADFQEFIAGYLSESDSILPTNFSIALDNGVLVITYDPGNAKVTYTATGSPTVTEPE